MRLARRLLAPPLAALAVARAPGPGRRPSGPRRHDHDGAEHDSLRPDGRGQHDGYVFLTGNVSGTTAITVTNLSGQYKATLDSGTSPGDSPWTAAPCTPR